VTRIWVWIVICIAAMAVLYLTWPAAPAGGL